MSIVSVHLRSIRAVVKSQKRDLTVDGYVNIVTLTEIGNMNADKYEEYFTSGQSPVLVRNTFPLLLLKSYLIESILMISFF